MNIKKSDGASPSKKSSAEQNNNYLYNWNYGAYRNALHRRQEKGANHFAGLIAATVTLAVLLLLSVVFFSWRMERLEEQLEMNGNMESSLPLQTTQDVMLDENGGLRDEYVSLFHLSALKIKLTPDGNVTGYGFLLENGYVLTDITCVPDEFPYVEDADGNVTGCCLLFSDLDTHIAVLQPLESMQGRALSFGGTGDVGDAVCLVGNIPSHSAKPAIEVCSVVSRGADTLILNSKAVSAISPLGVVCDSKGALVGAYTSLGEVRILYGLKERINSETQRMQLSPESFGASYMVDFDADTTYENVSISDSNLYHVPQGVRITSVVPDSNAMLAGIQENDIIYEINDIEILSAMDLKRSLENLDYSIYTATIYRDGKDYFVRLTLPVNDAAQADENSSK